MSIVYSFPSAGSPPHAWGRRALPCRRVRNSRFTPTCVGKTRPLPSPCPLRSVHPHMRGEDYHADIADFPRPRFPPTCVGKTGGVGSAPVVSPVHPHMRGEDIEYLSEWRQFVGSPPHAWGRPSATPAGSLQARFTPTCVGKTRSLHPSDAFPTVHPHVRGEDLTASAVRRLLDGSPARAWGRRETSARRRGCPSVHPHVRGEDFGRRVSAASLPGSPPRAWGRLVEAW